MNVFPSAARVDETPITRPFALLEATKSKEVRNALKASVTGELALFRQTRLVLCLEMGIPPMIGISVTDSKSSRDLIFVFSS